MLKEGISRRQFIGGAAAVAAASAMPVLTSAAPAVATPALYFPGPSADWAPLDPTAAARGAYEIYRGKYTVMAGAPAGAQGG
jgi:hypothetical protein